MEEKHIGYKRAKYDLIIKLEIMGDNNEHRAGIVCKNLAKMRCSQVKVIDIYHKNTGEKRTHAMSLWSRPSQRYQLGDIITPNRYEDDIDIVCGPGIHYFLSERVAKRYSLNHASYRKKVILDENYYQKRTYSLHNETN